MTTVTPPTSTKVSPMDITEAVTSASVPPVRETVPSWVSKGRIPCLDGIRGVAILIVILEHVHNTHNFNYPVLYALAERCYGLGTGIFFVVSGFLITLLLMREKDRTGKVSLGGFYMRRALRLMPAFAAFLIVLFSLNHFGYLHSSPADWIHVLTYTVNFQIGASWETTHLWSLSIEEQFYFIWPLTFLILGRERGRTATIAWLALAPFLRLAAYLIYPRIFGSFDYTAATILSHWTPFKLDYIAMGCLLALYSIDPRFCGRTEVRNRAAKTLIGLAIFGLALAAWIGKDVTIFDIVLRPTVNAICIATVIWLAANHSKGMLGKFLLSRPMIALGTMAYSIYLWQQFFLHPDSRALICSWPLNVVLAAAAAVASYFVIEKPFLQLKERLNERARRSSPGQESGAPEQAARWSLIPLNLRRKT